ncbi:MAG: hypothetical protein ACM3NN_10030 [Nitrospirota bacterium]
MTKLVATSLDETSEWKRYLNNGLISNLIVVGLTLVLSFVGGVLNRRIVPRLSFDSRRTLNSLELTNQFNRDASVMVTPDDGMLARGGGAHGHSSARYNNLIVQSFSVAATIKPIRRENIENYWRAGFTMRRPGGGESVTVHIDNHNLLVGYLGGQLRLRLPLDRNFENRWTLVQLDLSYIPPLATTTVHCHIGSHSWLVGEIPNADFPLTLELRAWSDDHQHHNIFFRDISLSHPVA